MLRQIGIDLLDQFGIMGAILVQPEHGRSAGRPSTRDSQFHPILNRGILDLAGTPNVTLFNLVLVQRLARRIHDPDRTVAWCFEGLIVRAVLLCRLRHQPDVWNRPHRLWIKGPLLLTELDDFVIDRRIAGVRNHTLDVSKLPIRSPHLAAIADDRRHGGIDDDVAWHMEIGDTLIAVHHRHRRPLLINRLNVGLDRLPLLIRQ